MILHAYKNRPESFVYFSVEALGASEDKEALKPKEGKPKRIDRFKDRKEGIDRQEERRLERKKASVSEIVEIEGQIEGTRELLDSVAGTGGIELEGKKRELVNDLSHELSRLYRKGRRKIDQLDDEGLKALLHTLDVQGAKEESDFYIYAIDRLEDTPESFYWRFQQYDATHSAEERPHYFIAAAMLTRALDHPAALSTVIEGLRKYPKEYMYDDDGHMKHEKLPQEAIIAIRVIAHIMTNPKLAPSKPILDKLAFEVKALREGPLADDIVDSFLKFAEKAK